MNIQQPDSFSFGKLCRVKFVNGTDNDNDTDSLYMKYYLIVENNVSSDLYSRYNCINFALFTPEILQSFQNDCKSIKVAYKDKKYKVELHLQLSIKNESNITISRKYISDRCADTIIIIDKLRSVRVFNHGFYASYGTPINDRSIKAYNEWLQTKHIVKMFPDVSYKIAVLER